MFITFEGGEGSGKTSLIKEVSKWMIENGKETLTTREPGGSFIAEQIRKVILDNKNVDMSPKTEALLFAASRIQHLEEIILPALNDNKIVLCDRYIDSSLAYQGYARGLGLEAILKANNFVLGHMPNYTVYIDVDPEIGLNRAHSRGMANRLDNETLAFHQKVREGYLLISQTYKERFIIIDGNCDMKTLVERTITKLKDVLKW